MAPLQRAVFLLATFVVCTAQVVNINAGGPNVGPDWRCDTGKFVTTPNSFKYTSPRPIDMPTGPAAIYQSHRWTTAQTLDYKLPVPAGSYDVQLLFAETWPGSGIDKRLFTITINDVPLQTSTMDTVLDIFVMTGGFDKPYLLDAGVHSSVGGFLTISLGRIAGKNNPMISGIVIAGAGADELIGSEGLESCLTGVVPSTIPGASATASTIPEASESSPGTFTTSASPPPPFQTPAPSGSFMPSAIASAAPSISMTIAPSSSSSAVPSGEFPSLLPVPSESKLPASPSAAPSMGPICGKEVETEFEETHFAHAVAGGPYVETDFKKQGFAAVNLDGTNSHSHFQSDTENGKITEFKWMWQDPTNPNAGADGMVIVMTSKSTQNFPIGVTTLTLVVVDQFCNSASETTTVTVNSATMPGAYCYYYNYGSQKFKKVPLPFDKKTGPKPEYGLNVGDINFGTTDNFGTFPFKQNTFAVRCSFFIDILVPAEIQYKVIHSGPVKIYHEGTLLGSSTSKKSNKMTETKSKIFSEGLQEWQVLYLRPAGVQGSLKFLFASGAVIPASTVRHDSAGTLPIITGISKTQGSVEELLFISGMSFVNGVTVKFGTAEATTVEGSATSIQARVPAGSGTVDVTVTTKAGVSNGVTFTYKAAESFPIKFKEDTIKTTAGTPYVLQKIAVVKFGPDGRLYCGATNSKIYALTLNKDLQVTKKCEKNVFEQWTRAVLGLGFDPTKDDLKLFFTTSTIYWGENNIITDPAIGWKNGKVKSVTMAGPNGCFNNDVADVVTGLPVSNHDHAVQAIQFLQGGKMIMSIGGFTNGGISIPGDKLGGYPSNPLAGALVDCPTTGTDMVYTSSNPLLAEIQSGACKIYAAGFRNTFAVELHPNGKLYATDNGPNTSFGDFSTDCAGGQAPSKTIQDKFILVQSGKCHGHPSINRGLNGNPAECAFEDSRCVKPLIGNLQSSTNGVMVYRSNIFGDKLKGNVFLSKYAGGNEGRLTRVVLNDAGTIASNGVTQVFWQKSGLSIVEGPRGEMIMSRVFKSNFFVLKPDYPTPTEPFFISVMPRRGPAGGGTIVLVTGHNFGASPTATFATKACTGVKVIDGDSFTCVVPSGSKNSQVKVSVSTGTGSATGTGTDYWYF